MTTERSRLFVTHSGTFHLDDAFAYAALRLAHGLGASGTDHQLVRTRDREVFVQAEMIWDVGGIYDAATGRFDHHQRDAPKRASGTPLSAAGLVWRRHGEAAVAALLGASATEATLVAHVVAEIDRDVVNRIDEIDHGEKHPEDSLGLSSVVEDCNLSWDSPDFGNQAAEDAAFLLAAGLVEGFLRRRVEAVRARLAATSIVFAAHQQSAHPHILEIDRKMPWQDPVFQHELPVDYAVYPVARGNWMVDSMPLTSGSYAQRLPLPAAWAGLLDAELANASGIPDAVFVHRERFVGAARSRAGAMAMAHRALELGRPQR